jgi:hypothetical protein
VRLGPRISRRKAERGAARMSWEGHKQTADEHSSKHTSEQGYRNSTCVEKGHARYACVHVPGAMSAGW